MNIIYFIRLFLRHAVILILMPVVLFVLVFIITKNQSRTYTSNTTIYTGIATGSSIVSLENSKYDMFGTRAAFDNLVNIIKSRGTAEEVGLRLFASHMIIDKPELNIISDESYAELMKMIPDEVKALAVKGDLEKTYQNLKKYKEKNYVNFIYELIQLDNPHYSTNEILKKLKVSRLQSSDLISLNFSSDDPGICYNTLQLITNVFIKTYSEIKVNQSDAVVKYFTNQLDNTSAKLSEAENELLEFNKTNNIINYAEQTKHIASEKENFDLEFQQVQRNYAAAQAVLKVLENKLNTRQKATINTRDIQNLRNQLSDINLDIAMKTYQSQLDSVAEEKLVKEISALQIRSYELQEELKTAVDKQYFIDNSVEGVSSTKIIDNWVDKVIEFESAKAQLIIGEQKKKEFAELFRTYAPLGATMKRLERKIDVAEREYLSILQSLNLAKLKQQNIELNSNLRIAEPPFFPIQPEPDKRKYLLIIAFMIGFIIPAFIILVLDFFDRNIKNDKRARDFSGLKVAGMYPNLQLRDKKIDLNFVEKRALELIVQKLQLFSENNSTSTRINLIISSLEGDGKTTIVTALLNKMSLLGYKSLFLTYNTIDKPVQFEYRTYELNNHFQKIENIEEIDANFEGLELKDYDYIFVELPGIIHHSIPLNLLKKADQIFLIIRANRAWTVAETNATKDILKVTSKNKLQILLNGVELQEMEVVLGDLPRKRSFLRRFLKNILRLHFFSQNNVGKSKETENKKKRSKFWLLLLPIPALIVFFFLPQWKQKTKQPAQPATREKVKTQTTKVTTQEKPLVTSRIGDSSFWAPAIDSTDTTKSIQPGNSVEPTESYYLIGGSFSSIENAANYINQLKKMGYQPTQLKKNDDLFTVAIGTFSTIEQARKAQQDYILKNPGSEAWIWKDTINNQQGANLK
ncbi:MAG: SPOR domain-containing protein [Prolixibacteraceae bacterium]|nr:SPOR domain-containing protein [Prolixibacteraceae bacterium]